MKMARLLNCNRLGIRSHKQLMLDCILHLYPSAANEVERGFTEVQMDSLLQ